MKKRGKATAALLAAVLFFSGCGGGASSGSLFPAPADTGSAIAPVGEEYVTNVEVSRTSDNVTRAVQYVFAMDTEIMLEAFGENAEAAVRAAGQEVLRIDQLLSVGIGDSEIARLNREGSAEVSGLTLELVGRGIEIGKTVGGAFDITVYPLMEAWGFTDKDYRVPSKEKIRELLACVGADKVRTEERTPAGKKPGDEASGTEKEPAGGPSDPASGEKKGIVTLAEGTRLDLGGIAKGYASGRLMEIFRKYGVDAALVSLGGNVQTYGRKTNGKDWNIAIQSPEKDGKYLGVLACHDAAVVTSGGYERYFEEAGVTYHHILDPKTGYPANAGLKSVTVVSRDGTLADALSTALYVLGPENAVSFWREHAEEFGFILLKDDGTLLVSENLAEGFSSELPFERIVTVHTRAGHSS